MNSRAVGRIFAFAFALGVFPAPPLRAADPAPAPILTIPRVPRPPTLEDFLGMSPPADLDGRMARVENFIQQDPKDGDPATQRTEVYVGYDDKNFYAVFVCFDTEPDKVRARLVRREDVFGDDQVEVMLDSFFDRRRAYVFLTNPLGIQWDALWTEGQGFDSSFDTLWDSRGQRTDQGYVVWMSIPFRSLRFSASSQQTWGIIFHRAIPRLNERDFWPRVSSRVEGRLSQEATLAGLESISPGRNIQLIPYGVFRSFRALDTRDPAHPAFRRQRADPDLGLDAKFVLRDSLVLDLTFNPDFAQVESDEPQVTVNQRFEVFFPEKRPFFLENSSFFDTTINTLFTRRIADPQFGARLTGKTGPWALGALFIDDQSPGRSVPVDHPLRGTRAYFGVVRVNRDIFKQSTLGLVFTDRELEAELGGLDFASLPSPLRTRFNRVGGLDGRFKFRDNWVLTWQALASSTKRLDASRLAGPAYDFEWSRDGRQFFLFGEYNDRSPGFRTLPGFLRRFDIRRVSQFVGYRFRPEGKHLIAWGPNVFVSRLWDHAGTRLDYVAEHSYNFSMHRETFFGFFWSTIHERLRPSDLPTLADNRDFAKVFFGGHFGSTPVAPVSFFLSYVQGRGLNFVPPPGQAPYLADLTDGYAELTLRPLTPFRIDHTYIFSRLADRDTGANVFQNHILRSKYNYQFTRELSLRVILQYSTVLPNSSLTALTASKSFNADVLLIYFLHPGTALYVGYNGNAQNIFVCNGPGRELHDCPELPAGSAELIQPRRRFIHDAKQFFVKFSYLFRF